MDDGLRLACLEAKLNVLPQVITEIDGLDIHFIHVRSAHEDALGLIVNHGWPGSIIEQLKIIDRLTDPTAHGGSASDAFHVVIPSMPGYGFSGKPTTTGWGPERMGRAWSVLMTRLGYSRYVAQGDDWARSSSTRWACRRPRHCSPSTPTCRPSFRLTSTGLPRPAPRPHLAFPPRNAPRGRRTGGRRQSAVACRAVIRYRDRRGHGSRGGRPSHVAASSGVPAPLDPFGRLPRGDLRGAPRRAPGPRRGDGSGAGPGPSRLAPGPCVGRPRRDRGRRARAAGRSRPRARGSRGRSRIPRSSRGPDTRPRATSAAPGLLDTVRAFGSDDLTLDEAIRFAWLAACAATDLWDDRNWDVLTRRHLDAIRSIGALSVLPVSPGA
jgi:hypothetical protein